MTRLRLLALAPLAYVASACLDVGGPVRERVGLPTVRAYLDGATPVVRATASFFHVAALNTAALTPAPCQLFEYSPTPIGVSAPTLDAGANVSFSNGASSVVAAKVVTGSDIRYEMAGGAFISFTAGDTLLFTAPGAVGGFEATTVKVRLAEPFSVGPVEAPAINQPIPLTWTAATEPGSLMIVSLRYNRTGSSVIPDAEISCRFVDNGTGQVPVELANAWTNADGASKSFVFSRFREGVVDFDSRTRTLLRSFYDVPTPALPSAAPALQAPPR